MTTQLDRLKEQIRMAMERKPGAVVVISSCVSGIIGDDIREVENMSTPEIPVIPGQYCIWLWRMITSVCRTECSVCLE